MHTELDSSSNMDKDGNIGIEPSTETVYGTHDDNTMVMSEKVNHRITCDFGILKLQKNNEIKIQKKTMFTNALKNSN